MAKSVTALVIARIDPIGDSLLVLLQSLPQVETVQRARSYPAARQLIKHIHPALVLLDADSHDQKLIEAIQSVRLTWPQTRIIALVESEAQQHAARHAGADAAFIEGIQAKKLLDATELLLQAENNGEADRLKTLPSREEIGPNFSES